MYFLIFELACTDLPQSHVNPDEIFSDGQIQQVLGEVKSIVDMWGDEQYGSAYAQLHQLYKGDLHHMMNKIREEEPEVNLRLETQVGQMLYLMQNKRYPTDDRLPQSFMKLLESELRERVVVVSVEQDPATPSQ